MSRIRLGILVIVVLAAIGSILLTVDLRPRVEYVEEVEEEEIVDLLPLNAYGIAMDGRVMEEGKIAPGATFGDLLGKRGVPMTTVHALVELAKPRFDVRRMRSGHPYAFVRPAVSGSTPTHFIYEVDALEYLVFELQDSLSVRVTQRPVTVEENALSVAVTGALYNDMIRAGADPELAMALSEVFAWTVDFQRIQKNDTFTVVYSQQMVDGTRYGTPGVLAARYTSGGRVKEAFRFEQAGGTQYFDADGMSLRKAFLKAPLKYSRISSGFSSRRLHPVQKVMKAHLGTDYAAPYGTPILAVGDGVVETAGQTGGNGKFVKIRHNGTYSTQYLHMRRILVRQGQRVAQGDVIGEVGSTGLATGPHVCFRFWKNGVQVDHRREEFPSSEPIAKEQREVFERERNSLNARLDEAVAEAHRAKLIVF